jgi:outer membrane protein
VLYTQEAVINAQKQYDLTQQQVARQQQIVDAGGSAKGPLLDLQSQLATEEVALVAAQNNSTIAYLNLEQLMNLDSTRGFQIQKPDLTVPAQNILNTTPEAIYLTALNNQPSIKKAQLDLKSADKGVDVAYGAYSPSLTVQASVGTGYSGAAKQLNGLPQYNGYDTIGVTSGGDLVFIPNYSYQYATTPFADQFNNNVNKSFGVQLAVPIFNRFQVNSSVAKAKIARENAELTMDLSQQQLLKSIQQAYADAQAAFLKYQASQKAVDAAQQSFQYTEDKFNVGAAGVGTIEYNNAKNKLAQAESDLLQAKFDYIFRMKILDYYQGIPLTF